YVINRFRRVREELVAVVKGTILLGLFVIAATFGMQDRYESRLNMAIFLALTAIYVFTWRRLSWFAIRWLRRRGFNQTHAIIVGTGGVGGEPARALRKASWRGIKPVGFVEDEPSRWASDLDVLGRAADLPELIAKYSVSHVFISLPMNRYHDARRVFDIL